MYDLGDALSGNIDRQVCTVRSLILDIDTSDALELSSTRAGVDTLPVAHLAMLQRRRDVHNEDVAASTSAVEDSLLDGIAGRALGGDGCGNDCCAGTSKLCCNKPEALQVL